jgi:hypothetical protein
MPHVHGSNLSGGKTPGGFTEYEFELPLRTERELEMFVDVAFGVRIPRVAVCKGHCSPWRAFADAYFARDPVSVWKASRGFGGKSFLLSLLSLVEAVTLRAEVNLLGGSGQQSERVLEAMNRLWHYEGAPRRLLVGEAKKVTTLRNGAKIQALMASQRSVRGPHPQRLRMDEVDEMDLAILDAAMGQPMTRNGIRAQTVLSSTHQNPDGTMTEILKRAADVDVDWPVYEWCYHETLEPHGWLSALDLDDKRRSVSKAMFEVEYDLQEPSVENRVFDTAAVSRMFRDEMGSFKGLPGEDCQAAPPREKATYATGADWARKQDWTIIVTLRTDVTPMKVVKFLRIGRQPWPSMLKRFDDRIREYPGAACHDGTGLGDVVDGFVTAVADPIMFVGRERSNILSEYVAAVERGEIESPTIEMMEADHRYATWDDVYGSGHCPDSIVAMALAYRAARMGAVAPAIW